MSQKLPHKVTKPSRKKLKKISYEFMNFMDK